ncbi:polysulfide reductase NrfD family protein [Desulfobulbus oligotrophicus]|jgi:Ni/Fe-hydrogenase subunit HybB-like protein|uniref:Polysulfide reductase n=1 Tax=Desulfobulbus oligotrophicus TaxID=1909699 RepID=A0A7T6AQH0_9BACT|nr:polysulfide reductase [Desulfobulbus oligotrophicus]MDY0389633.1 polysulfide reductase [Desulfobulbus oligotrophicus]QQG65463.1 polysulfide reductase [Desulfobulbus oligotrophicus]
MKTFIENKPATAIPIVSHLNPTGGQWNLKEKLWLGLSKQEYKEQFLRNPVNWVLIFIFAIGIPILLQRYIFGLGSITHASNDYPWGLFLGFGLFGMVPLSASGFLLGTTVEIFGRKDFTPIERLALLNGLLGYFFAVVYLLVDLGMPWRLYYPMIVSLGPAAVLFLVAWHVATYLSVQIAEVSSAFFEWIGWLKGKRFIKSITIGLTVSGIILSTLHQGALGALFTYAPAKVHPLWLSANFQWIHFFCSAIFAGLSMVIVSAALCKRYMTWRCDNQFLHNIDRCTLGLGKGCAYALITYLVIKLVGVAHDNEWAYLLTGWGQYFMLEMALAVILPMILFAYGVKHQRVGMVRFAAWISVFGIIWNRLNTSMICFNWQMYQEIPHWKEIWATITVFAIYFIVYRFILYRLPILYQWQGER